MYYVTYKNVLRPDREFDDFKTWLETYWPIQKKWGATSFKLWHSREGENQVLFCRYTVENIDRWNQGVTEPEAETLVKALNEVVDIRRMAIKITVPSDPNA